MSETKRQNQKLKVGIPNFNPDQWKIFIAWGAKILGQRGDLYDCEFPAGWTLYKVSDCYTQIKDNLGRVRGCLGYGNVLIMQHPRYEIGQDLKKVSSTILEWTASVRDTWTEAELFKTPALSSSLDIKHQRSVSKEVDEIAERWMFEHFPNLNNPLADL